MVKKPKDGLVASGSVSGAALARHLDCTAQVITDYEARKIIERLPGGKFDQDACRRRVLVHLRDRAAGRTGNTGSGSDLATARTELAIAQREAVEWKNAVNRGDFVSSSAVIRRLQDTFAIQRTLLLSWAGKLPSQIQELKAADIEAILEREVYEVLETLASPDTYTGRPAGRAGDEEDREGRDVDVPAAAEAKPGGVGRQPKKSRR